MLGPRAAATIAAVLLLLTVAMPRGLRLAPPPDRAEARGREVAVSTPLYGVCDHNVRAALGARGGALQLVTVAPGETFSFNATMGDPAAVAYDSCGGVPGGGWCNLASRYAEAARAVGLAPRFPHHGIDLGNGWENAVSIWNIGGRAGTGGGAQDLEITNTRPEAVTFRAIETADGIAVAVAVGIGG